jgi:crotonobetainyl-CoA:carnitine CoA-transferase CaiB-like acyl-CoA transferase
VTRIPHPTVGWVPNVRLPIRYSRTPIVDPVAAPAVGQHTQEVLGDWLGYGEDRLAELAQAGALGADQRAPQSAES